MQKRQSKDSLLATILDSHRRTHHRWQLLNHPGDVLDIGLHLARVLVATIDVFLERAEHHFVEANIHLDLG